eukprot:jgi/Botrbrau1/20837/Bobra.0156s0062.1
MEATSKGLEGEVIHSRPLARLLRRMLTLAWGSCPISLSWYVATKAVCNELYLASDWLTPWAHQSMAASEPWSLRDVHMHMRHLCHSHVRSLDNRMLLACASEMNAVETLRTRVFVG